MVALWGLLAHLVALAALAVAKSSTGDDVLVVLEPSLKREDYSLFFGGLEKRGYNLTFRAPKDTAPALIEDGLPTYSHVILFAPETKTFASDITPQALVSLLSLGTNLVLALGTKQNLLSALAPEFALVPAPPGTPLLSHFPARAGAPTTLPIRAQPHPALDADLNDVHVWYEGGAHALGASARLVPLLRAPAHAFAADSTGDAGADALVDAAERGGEGLWAGSALSVLTGFEARTGARALWTSGVRLFSDELAKIPPPGAPPGTKNGNEMLCADAAGWAFQERLVLRIDNTTHHRKGESEPREAYTTGDELVYTAHISKFDAQENAWVPYGGLDDVQLEFTMLDPHVRTALPPVAGQPGAYSAAFRAPDRHGVFKFVVDYKRKGWTHLQTSTVVPVVPPRHDEYPRFLSAAWPYYAGAVSTSAAFVLFAALWLAGDDRDLRKKKGAAKTE